MLTGPLRRPVRHQFEDPLIRRAERSASSKGSAVPIARACANGSTGRAVFRATGVVEIVGLLEDLEVV